MTLPSTHETAETLNDRLASEPGIGESTSTRLRTRVEASATEHPLYPDRNGGF